MPVVVRESGLTMLLTERTAHLTDHAGQVSFPGGGAEPRRDPDDEQCDARRDEQDEREDRPELVDRDREALERIARARPLQRVDEYSPPHPEKRAEDASHD